MYNKNFGHSRGFGGNNRFKRAAPNRNRFSSNIDISMYVRKAVSFTTIEEAQTVNTFSSFGLEAPLLANVLTKGYVKPTEIQDKTIGQIMAGRDVLGIAHTGTGKTAAFAIPLINRILKNPQSRMLILAPTRELAAQIKQEIRSFTPGLRVYVTLAIGGAFIREQILEIKRGPNIIIGTPGRVMDLAKRKVLNFGIMDTVVLDEVDRMLDMGFVDDIKRIMAQIPTTRQTLFFSATVDKKVESLIDTFLTNPVKITIKSQEASSHVEQDIVRVVRSQKQETLLGLLTKEEFKKVLVFGATKRMVDTLTRFLAEKGLPVDSIHGDKPQHKRQKVMRMFKEDQISILIATDVAARGLDVPDITHVINYDRPNNYEDYVHRIGRTGRGNNKGYALTFVE